MGSVVICISRGRSQRRAEPLRGSQPPKSAAVVDFIECFRFLLFERPVLASVAVKGGNGRLLNSCARKSGGKERPLSRLMRDACDTVCGFTCRHIPLSHAGQPKIYIRTICPLPPPSLSPSSEISIAVILRALPICRVSRWNGDSAGG